MAKLVRLKGIKQDDRGRTVYELVEMSDKDTVTPGQDTSDDLGAQYLQLSELGADAAAPAANKARLYSRDNGSGKTQIVARFPTGAVQVIATEP